MFTGGEGAVKKSYLFSIINEIQNYIIHAGNVYVKTPLLIVKYQVSTILILGLWIKNTEICKVLNKWYYNNRKCCCLLFSSLFWDKNNTIDLICLISV